MIGIITFHRAVNYGALLQCYALQQSLAHLGYDSEVIDYRNNYIEKLYSPAPSVSIIHIRQFIKEMTKAYSKWKKRTNFRHFLMKNIKCSEKCTKDSIEKLSKKYSVIITGSDQVWNLAITGYDTTYFLDFVKEKGIKKVSYAASMGPKEIKNRDKDIIRNSLADIDCISVREMAAVDAIKDIIDKPINLDVDPTILCPRESWEAVASKSKCKYKKFIFVYVMQPSSILLNVAKTLSIKENLEIIYMPMTEVKEKVGTMVQDIGIEDFLWLIQNANYIVTNSYHGILFSLIFKKDFFWAYQKGCHMSNPRFDMLQQQYEINRRLCVDENYENVKPLDYDIIHDTMMQLREQSSSHLIDSLKKF